MTSLSDLMPMYLPGPGLLPKWLLLVSTMAFGNSIQSYLTLVYTRRVYCLGGPKVTDLSSRTFGTWTFLSAMVRVYAAYNIATPAVYDICLWSYVVAFAHFFSEWLVFKTARLNEGLLGPVLVSTMSILWMASQREAYLAGGNV